MNAFYAVECYYVLYLVAQSSPTLCNLMDYSPQDSSVLGDSTSKNAGVVAMPSSREYSQNQGWNPGLLYCRWILYLLSYQGKAKYRSFLFSSVSTFTQFRYIAGNILSVFPILLVKTPHLRLQMNSSISEILYMSFRQQVVLVTLLESLTLETVFIIFSTAQNKLPVSCRQKVKKWKLKFAQLCPTLFNPMDCAVHGILQARILEWVAFPFSSKSKVRFKFDIKLMPHHKQKHI